LEWGRLMSYLEQSTRYINYDARLGGRYRYYRDPEILSGPYGTRYVGDMDRMFDSYSSLVQSVTEHVRKSIPRGINDSDFVYRQATRAMWAFLALVRRMNRCCCACVLIRFLNRANMPT
ncbi:MAG: hypothetical protein GM46_10795, partial [actinobacterium acAcidi]